MGVSQGKIFIINPQSEITSETGVRIFQQDGVAKKAQQLAVGISDSSFSSAGTGEAESSGYATMTDLVDHIFPFVETDVLTEAGTSIRSEPFCFILVTPTVLIFAAPAPAPAPNPNSKQQQRTNLQLPVSTTTARGQDA